MPARLTAYVPDQAAVACLLRPPQRLIVGRAEDCGFRIDHPSVSRRHAELWRDDEHWRVIDLGSKNGTFLGGARIGSVRLDRSGWLRFGDVHCEFEALTAEAADAIEQRFAQRRADSQALVSRLQAQTRLPDLLAETVRAAVELAGGERGFLLFGAPGALRIVASHGLDPASLQSREFTGSVGAIERALRAHAPVVLNDVSADPDLASRLSVVSGGLRSLLCVPLLHDGQCLGLIYADSRTAGAPVTAFELDLLSAFAERATVWIAARRGVADLDALLADAAPAWREVLSAQQMAAA